MVSEILRPVEDIDCNTYKSGEYWWQSVYETTVQPDIPSGGEWAIDSNDVYNIVGFSDTVETGTITSIKIWAFTQYLLTSGNYWETSFSTDEGANWSSTKPLYDSDFEWQSAEWTGSWTTLQLDAIRVKVTSKGLESEWGDAIDLRCLYIEITYAGGNTYGQTAQETLILADTFLKSKLTNLSRIDAIVLTDNFLNSKITQTLQTDIITLNDTFLKSKITQFLGSENISLLENLSISKTGIIFGLNLTENISLSDTINISGFFAKEQIIEETLNLNDMISLSLITSKTAQEILNLSDVINIAPYTPGLYDLYPNETLNISDVINISKLIRKKRGNMLMFGGKYAKSKMGRAF